MRIVMFLLTLCFLTACQHRQYRTPPEFEGADLKLADSLTGVSTTNEGAVKITLPDLLTHDNSVKTSELIDSIWYVPLETNDSSLLSYIDQVNEFNGSYVILDILAETILVFDKKGKFIRQLGSRGKGPGEYLHPTAFTIDRDSNEIVVHDDYTSKIIHYDKDGVLKREEMMKYSFLQFIKTGDRYIISSDRAYNNHLEPILNKKLLFASSTWKIDRTAFAYDWNLQHELATNRRALIQTGDYINYNASFTYDIYHILDSNISKAFSIDAGMYALPEGFDNNLSIEEFNHKYEKRDANKIYITSPPVENSTHLMLKMNMGLRFVFLYYSKKTGRLLCSSRYVNDQPGCVGPPMSSDVIDDIFVGYLSAIEVAKYKRSIEKDNSLVATMPVAFKAMCDTIKDIDNPILTFVKLKQF